MASGEVNIWVVRCVWVVFRGAASISNSSKLNTSSPTTVYCLTLTEGQRSVLNGRAVCNGSKTWGLFSPPLSVC